ncbi:type IV pilus modification protein PilV [Pelobacter seleniigenes]|uniref:type IV pilus modification protein PilV n=1 Tax=Pelobacter seleniigenes TaxID=407188 RepID=UPI0004A73CC9|nr:type IV pilus modification protein PilV [Pelobacter seleniigenes]
MNQFAKEHNQGFTLIELLIALLVLSIGLLAVAGLQINGLRGGHNALSRSIATQLCQDALDRMRANRDAALHSDYDIAYRVTPTSSHYSGITLTDLEEWKNALANNLPGGDGTIEMSSSVAAVTVQWQDSYGEDSVSVESRL